ncbi:MAG: pccB [Actinomycetia bacterium]|nr:pccB [Actinomycetes bacterium]
MTLDLRAGVPGTITVAVEELGGRLVVLARSQPGTHKGALDSVSGETLATAAETALKYRLPLVAVLASSGADVHEGVAALDGWGRAARAVARCSGVVPILMAVTGPTVSGPALMLGMADIVVATEHASAYVVGPQAVADFTGERLTAEALGGAGSLRRNSGVVASVVADEAAALDLLGAIVAIFPDSCDDLPPRWPTGDPADRLTPELNELVPATATGSYDVRDVARGIVDDGELLDLWGGWAPNLVTAFGALDGRPIGIVANQPISLAGTIDIPASQKGARFVELCDAFNFPILTLVDTPGFFPGKDLEWRGMIRHGAQLVGAYARATVPRVCLVLRKAYGGAYIVMDSRRMGNDICLAWPVAELAVMGAKGAVEILHRRSTPEERAAAEHEYATTLLTPWVAAERGYVDDVIAPEETRLKVAAAFELLNSKRENLPGRAHDNLPL